MIKSIKRIGRLAFTALTISTFAWFSYKEVSSGAIYADTDDVEFYHRQDKADANRGSALAADETGFWQLIDANSNCISIPKLRVDQLEDADGDVSTLRVSQVSITISIYSKQAPSPDLPTTADSVLMPKVDFFATLPDKVIVGPVISNDEVCDLIFLSDTGSKSTLEHILKELTTSKKDVAILQIYVNYVDNSGTLRHSASIFRRSDSSILKRTAEI